MKIEFIFLQFHNFTIYQQNIARPDGNMYCNITFSFWFFNQKREFFTPSLEVQVSWNKLTTNYEKKRHTGLLMCKCTWEPYKIKNQKARWLRLICPLHTGEGNGKCKVFWGVLNNFQGNWMSSNNRQCPGPMFHWPLGWVAIISRKVKDRTSQWTNIVLAYK